MKTLLKLMCVVAAAFVLGGCNPVSKIKLHGVTNISLAADSTSVLGSDLRESLVGLFTQPSARTVILSVDAENELGLNVRAVEAKFTLSDGKKVYATASLAEPVMLRHKTRSTVQVPMNVEIEGGMLTMLSFARKALQSPETMTVQGEFVGKCMGVKKKKTLAPQPLSKFMSNFAKK